MAEEAGNILKTSIGDRRPQVALVLGSGLGGIADAVEDAVRVSYADLPGFPVPSVSSHRSDVVAGKLDGVDVAVLSGRAHYYEHGDAAVMRTPLEAMKAIGCSRILLTNSAGSLREDVGPAELMLVTDHINFAGTSPLFGVETDDRFVSLTNAYSKDLKQKMRRAAEKEGILLHHGVYMWFCGPAFETPAEIRMARTLGADAVGMSTVPEVLLARYLGLEIAAISNITNLAAGMTGAELSHTETKEVGKIGAKKLEKLIRAFLRELSDDR